MRKRATGASMPCIAARDDNDVLASHGPMPRRSLAFQVIYFFRSSTSEWLAKLGLAGRQLAIGFESVITGMRLACEARLFASGKRGHSRMNSPRASRAA